MNSLYIHIPFCERKCLYCSFVVTVGQQRRIDEYLSCVEQEAQVYRGSEVKTVYVGGGTPTFLDEPQLGKLMDIIRKNFKIKDAAAEMTIEANPEGLTLEKSRHLKGLGFNRLSLGIQSLQDKYLKLLGRCHDRSQAQRAYEALREAGFKNINVDLMFSFPGETFPELAEDLRAITALKSEHVSIYALTIEENSRFFAQKMTLDGNDLLAQQYLSVVQAMEINGLSQYEVSNFSRSGYESAHNMHYWQGGDYLGLGIGAHSHSQGRRWWNVSRLQEYIERTKDKESPLEDEEELSVEQRFLERLVFGLRTNRGIDLKDIMTEYNLKLDQDRTHLIENLVREGLLVQEGENVRTTLQGRLVLDEIAARLI